MKKIIITLAIIGSFAIASAALAQSTVSGTLSSGGAAATTSTSTSLSGSVGSGNTLTGTVSPNNTLTGSVGSGNTLTGTVTSTSSSSGGGGGGGGGGNGPPAGFLGGGGGVAVICPNLPGSLYTVPAGYVVLDGDCYPAELIGGSGPGIPNTGSEATSTTPGIPNTGAGGNAGMNLIVLAVSGLVGAFGGFSLYRRQFAKR